MPTNHLEDEVERVDEYQQQNDGYVRRHDRSGVLVVLSKIRHEWQHLIIKCKNARETSHRRERKRAEKTPSRQCE